MAIEIKMPKLSQTTEEVRLIRWLVKQGDVLQKGQPLCEVENDKTTMEVESFAGGTVLRLFGEPDTVITAGTLIAVLGQAGERIEEPKPVRQGEPEVTLPRPVAAGASVAGEAEPPAAVPATSDGIRATHLVRNLARKLNVDLSRVAGSGARGLVTKKDLEEYLRTGPRPGVVATPSAEYPLSANQQAIARNLKAALAQVPTYYLKTEVFADRLLEWRQKNRQPDGGKPSINALLVWACARALRRFPKLNGSLRGDRVVAGPGIHIGLAVAAGEELYVPVVRDADGKDIRQIDRELSWVVAKAQKGRLEPQDVAGGTFTVTNLGMYPIDEFCAIINPPQLGILAVGRIRKSLTVAEEGTMSLRSLCVLTGSFDHRAVNGAQGAAFLAEVKRILEEEL